MFISKLLFTTGELTLEILFIIITAIGISTQHISRKSYSNKDGKGALSFSASSAFVSLLVYLICSHGNLNFSRQTISFAFVFAIFFSMGILFSLLAINAGPLSLTSLITSYSLFIPTFYGIFMLNEPFTYLSGIGLILLTVSLFYTNFKRNDKGEKLSLRWAVYAFLSFAGNGICSTVQKIYQMKSDGAYKSEFMVIAYIVSAAILFVAAAIYEREDILRNIKKGIGEIFVSGVANAVVNLLVMVLSLRLAASFVFPIISAGSIMLTVLISVMYYKEKLSPAQKKGILFGLLAIIFLNI